jgi:hypothetical protein
VSDARSSFALGERARGAAGVAGTARVGAALSVSTNCGGALSTRLVRASASWSASGSCGGTAATRSMRLVLIRARSAAPSADAGAVAPRTRKKPAAASVDCSAVAESAAAGATCEGT